MRRVTTASIIVWMMAGISSRVHADDALQIIRKAIQAGGGKEKLAKYRAATLSGKGTLDTQGMVLEYTANWSVSYPGKYRIELEGSVMGQPFSVTQVFDGKDGWVKINDMAAIKMTEAQRSAIRRQLQVDQASRLLPLLDTKNYTVAPVGKVKVDGKDAIGLNVTNKSGLDVNLYFDTKTCLLVKQEYPSQDENGKEVTQTVFLRDFKRFNGIAFPTKLEIQHDGKKFVTAQFSTVELHEKIDENLFTKPK